MRSGYVGLIICFVFLTISETFSALPSKINTTSEIISGNFYQSVADYFKASQKEIQFIKETNLPDEEIPVVYFISRTAKTNVEDVVNLRLCGLRWIDITKYFDLDPKVFPEYNKHANIISCRRHAGYSSANTHFKRKYYRRYNDKEILSMINVKFISENHLCSSEYVRKLRKQGNDFVSINNQIIQEHRELLEEQRLKAREMEKLSGVQN